MAPRAGKKIASPSTKTKKGSNGKSKRAEVEVEDDEDIVGTGENEDDDPTGTANMATILKAFAVKSSRKSNAQLLAASTRIDELLKNCEAQVAQNVGSARANTGLQMKNVQKESERTDSHDAVHFSEIMKKQKDNDARVALGLIELEKRLLGVEHFWNEQLDELRARPGRFKKDWKKLNKALKSQNKAANELAEHNLNAGMLVVKHLKGALRGVSSI